MHEIDTLRQKLTTGLANALCRTAEGRLTDEAGRRAASMVLDGHGLPDDARQVFGDKPACSLLCFDAVGIGRWVFQSERIQVAGGASLRLDHLNQQAAALLGQLPEVCGEIYSAGGGGIFLCRAVDEPEALAERARQVLADECEELPFNVFVEPLKVHDLARSNPAQAIQSDPNLAPNIRRFQVVDGVRGALVRVQVRMEEIKSTRPQAAPAPRLESPRGGSAPRCASCGRRPPDNPKIRTDDPKNWCGWCRGQQCFFRKVRHDDFYVDDRALTFADLAESVDRQRQYLAFLAVDGNSMGNVVRGLRNFLELAAFSTATTAIYKAARTAAEETLQAFLKEGRTARQAHLSLLSGGDEITLVMPAAAGPRVARRVLRELEKGFEAATRPDALLGRAFADNPDTLEQLRNAGASAGLLLASNTYPVRLQRHYANALQNQAKTRAAAGPRSAIAWALLTDSSPLSEMLERPGLPRETFEQHLEVAEEAARLQMPTSALQAVLAQVRREHRTLVGLEEERRKEVLARLGANFFRYQLARNRPLAEWWQATEAARGPDGDPFTHWFRHGQGRELDRLLDLLSLDPIVQNKEVAHA